MLDKCDNRFGLIEKKTEYVEHTLNQVKTDLATLTMRSAEFVTKGDCIRKWDCYTRRLVWFTKRWLIKLNG